LIYIGLPAQNRPREASRGRFCAGSPLSAFKRRFGRAIRRQALKARTGVLQTGFSLTMPVFGAFVKQNPARQQKKSARRRPPGTPKAGYF